MDFIVPLHRMKIAVEALSKATPVPLNHHPLGLVKATASDSQESITQQYQMQWEPDGGISFLTQNMKLLCNTKHMA